MKTSVVLFDADGVLTLPEEVFSIVYARSRGLDGELFEQFFRNDWPSIVTGKKDLKESVSENPELWQWNGDVDELLKYWFKTEDVRNESLIKIIRELKARGLPCYLATDQEKYRAEYMKDVMFKDVFMGHYVSASLGVTKNDPKFFEAIVSDLELKYPAISPSEIVFFDDSQSKIDTAKSVGINGQLYQSVQHVKSVLADWLK